jgi:hypothetical protein
VIPAAWAAHGYDAILAVLAIIVWHIPRPLAAVQQEHVHRCSASTMLTSIPELADIKAGLAERPVDPKAVARRRRFHPGLPSALPAGRAPRLRHFEQTAITTAEPVDPGPAPLTATCYRPARRRPRLPHRNSA